MASTTSKLPTAATARRKSKLGQEIKPTLLVTLKLSPEKLRKFAAAEVKKESKEDSSSKDFLSADANAETAAATNDGDKPLESANDTPTASGTPAPTSSMPPPTEGVKKKGVKRTSTTALAPDGTPKVRGKPGPKKRPRLEDGSIDHSNSTPRAAPGTAAHKLGPKANQGAINAGLRALDRSGKPCRKWQKGSFRLKSFTGVVWELARWKAPPKVVIPMETSSQSSPSDSSSKENKDNSQIQSEKSNNALEKASVTSQNVSSSPPSLPAESQSATSITAAAVTDSYHSQNLEPDVFELL
ncbi:INO80 complex, subunit Ies4 [Bisporella sp. PMI_857]|nr:INO80 complex, subunit Ies4 [Bisporella sp. PMI_857]